MRIGSLFSVAAGLEMAGVLVNDSQVWHMTASKAWGTADRTHVTLRT